MNLDRIYSNYPILTSLFLIWLAGALIHFVLINFQMIWRFLWRNSIRNQNLRLVGMEAHWMAGMLRDAEPGDPTWKEELGFLGLGIAVMALSAVVSWIGILALLFVFVCNVYDWITTPSRIREIAWLAGRVAYRRAEDYLALMQEGYLPNAKGKPEKELSDAVGSARDVTYRYAMKAFADDYEAADWYVEQAQLLTEKRHDSKVIHPTFWRIPFTREAAERALGMKWSKPPPPPKQEGEQSGR